MFSDCESKLWPEVMDHGSLFTWTCCFLPLVLCYSAPSNLFFVVVKFRGEVIWSALGVQLIQYWSAQRYFAALPCVAVEQFWIISTLFNRFLIDTLHHSRWHTRFLIQFLQMGSHAWEMLCRITLQQIHYKFELHISCSAIVIWYPLYYITFPCFMLHHIELYYIA